MEKNTELNSKTWEEIYENSNFGNRYPSSYLVSLYYRIIKNQIVLHTNRPIKVLDFGCSFGANSKMLMDAGCDVYGIDISTVAIDYCVNELGFDKSKFRVCNVLENNFSIEKEFGKFDLIIASECLYYFTKGDLDILLKKFQDSLYEDGIFYTNMSTYHHELYKDYKEVEPDKDGMTRVESSGTADQPLFVRLIHNKEEMRMVFSCFKEITTLRTICEMTVENESLHYIGRKKNRKLNILV